jgi:glyceraldehyde 3-phosphate dehydrogenase
LYYIKREKEMKIAINGFGRIGRLFFRAALENGLAKDIVAINDLTSIENIAYLLKYDSAHGKLNEEVSIKDSYLIVGKNKILFLSEKTPENLPWKDLGIDLVIESSGVFRHKEDLLKHIKAGAKKVLLTAPAKDSVDITIVPGVNHNLLNKSHKIISMASCTTNCIAPMLKVLNDNYKINSGFFVTAHAVTASERTVDCPNAKDFREGRAFGINLIPTSTGASKAVAEVIPELKNKVNGYALRVPVIDGSLTHLSVTLDSKKISTKEEINSLFEKASVSKLKNILEYSKEQLVSSDIVHNSNSCVFDSSLTNVTGNILTIVGWYDNEWGYCNRLVDVIKLLR